MAALPFLWRVGGCFYSQLLLQRKLASAGAVMGNWQVGAIALLLVHCCTIFLSHLGIDEGGAQWRYSRRISPRQGNWGLLLYPARLGEIWQPKCFIWENMLRTNKFTRLSSLVQDMTWHSPTFLWPFLKIILLKHFRSLRGKGPRSGMFFLQANLCLVS